MNYKIIGKNIRRNRLSSDLTSDELADMVGMSPHGITGIERGANSRLSTIQKILDALGMTWEEAVEELHEDDCHLPDVDHAPCRCESCPQHGLPAPCKKCEDIADKHFPDPDTLEEYDGRCRMCRQRGKDWEGSDPVCFFVDPENNWNCATVNAIREIAQHTVQYVEDSRYATIDVSQALAEDDAVNFLCLFVSWYKRRGHTEQVYLMGSDEEAPRMPTEEEMEKILDYYSCDHLYDGPYCTKCGDEDTGPGEGEYQQDAAEELNQDLVSKHEEYKGSEDPMHSVEKAKEVLRRDNELESGKRNYNETADDYSSEDKSVYRMENACLCGWYPHRIVCPDKQDSEPSDWIEERIIDEYNKHWDHEWEKYAAAKIRAEIEDSERVEDRKMFPICRSCSGEVRQHDYMETVCVECGNNDYVLSLCPYCGDEEEHRWSDRDGLHFCAKCGTFFRKPAASREAMSNTRIWNEGHEEGRDDEHDATCSPAMIYEWREKTGNAPIKIILSDSGKWTVVAPTGETSVFKTYVGDRLEKPLRSAIDGYKTPSNPSDV